MGKGFENYMSKKWFHPTNVENMKRLYNAKQKDAEEKKRQAELRSQYEREQEFYSNKQLMGDEKARCGLSFMYNAPAGAIKDQDNSNKAKEEEKEFKELSERNEKQTKPEYKNIRCLKCKRMGHANTDKVCPLYGKSRLDEDFTYSQLDEDLIEKTNQQDAHEPDVNNKNEEDGELTLEMLKTLPKLEKKALLKRLNKLIKKKKI